MNPHDGKPFDDPLPGAGPPPTSLHFPRNSHDGNPFDAPLPGTRPSPTFTPRLAGSQPWVILALKATLVDLILGYEQRLEEIEVLDEMRKSLEKENRELLLERARWASLPDSECIKDAIEHRPDFPSQSLSQISDPEVRKMALDCAMEFLEKYCDPADVYDVRYGPIGERRIILYHGD